MSSHDVYELFQNGTRLLEEHDFHAAAVPLRRARELEPDKASIREALGRALFGSQRYAEAVAEFEAIVERAPDERLCAVLPRPLAAAARPSRRGAQAAGAGLLPAPRAQGLPAVPRPLARAGGVAPEQAPPAPPQAGGAISGPVLSSIDSFRSGFGPEAVPEVGARPLFLWP